MKYSKTFFFKCVAILTVFTFLTAEISWAIPDGIPGEYNPFDDTRKQSNYLTQDQLDNFENTKNALVDKYNTENPAAPLVTETEIITYLYSILNPQDIAGKRGR